MGQSIKVGFIGLGMMGMPIARSIARNGFPLKVYDLRKERVEEIQTLGAEAAGSCREVAAASDVVISMVRDIPQTEEVIFGRDGLWEGLKEGSYVILSSTLNPAYCRELYARAKVRGVSVIDCAVSGRDPSAGGRPTALMIGGDEDAVKQCWPVFEAMGKNIFHLGDIGRGQACKLVNNTVTLCNSNLIREALNLGLKAGLDLKQMVDVMLVSSAGASGVQSWGKRLQSPTQSLSPDAEASRKDMVSKDLRMALQLAVEMGAKMPITQLNVELDTDILYSDVVSALHKRPAA
jgi:3-hydroxyisobutyrate dehydrogenase-like beta-hydroxyacid dehydrogenase